jgi:hypothetical protein
MNAIRLWLAWDAFAYGSVHERQRFCANFETVLTIADALGMLVMPVLFNRWHNSFLDYGGVYIDHIVPNLAWAGRDFMQRNQAYMEAIVVPHTDDPRILAWDLCNEPFSYARPRHEIAEEIEEAEYDWLSTLYAQCKTWEVHAPVTIGTHTGMPLARVEPISDILSIHPYWKYGDDKDAYEAMLDDYVALAEDVGKPLLATETCWGHLDDAKRVHIIRYTLGELKARGIGWLVYLLHHSLIADAHRPAFGPVGPPGNLAFIEADGSLRPGHDVFNEF